MGKRKMRKGSALLALSLLALMLASMPAEAKAASKPKLSKKKVTMVAGTKKKLRVKNRNGRKVKWKSSNKKVATVTKSGKVKAKKPGKTVVTATVGKKKLKCKVTVKAGLNKKKVALKKGKSTTLKFTGTKKKVRWKTSNKKVASIKQVGRYKVRVTAKKKGTATITATVAGKKYRCKVTVKKASGSSWPSAKQEKKNIAAATKKAKKKVLALFGGKPEKYSEAERVWKVAKWICDNTGRSYDTAEWDEDEHSIAYKDGVAYSYGAAYSVYIFGRANAQGYSAAFQELLGAVGIEAERVDLEHWTFGANEVRVDGKGYLCCLFRMDTSWVYEHSKKRIL